MRTWICAVIVTSLVTMGIGCSDGRSETDAKVEPDASTDAASPPEDANAGGPGDANGDGDALQADDARSFVLDITCKDGSKPDLDAMPTCKELLDRLLQDCCPDPKETLNTQLDSMVCVDDPEGICQMVAESQKSFELTCAELKGSEFC